MTRKKIIRMVAFIIIGGIGAFGFLLYQTIKTKSTSLNKCQPFQQWVGKTVSLNKKTILFKEQMKSEGYGDYPYTLADSLHPQWQYLKDAPKPDVEQVAQFPAGTLLKLEKARQYTNGVSGTSSPTLLGAITANGITYKISYQWGEMSQEKFFDKVDKCWRFHHAPWQTTPDTAWYALPKATWW